MRELIFLLTIIALGSCIWAIRRIKQLEQIVGFLARDVQRLRDAEPAAASATPAFEASTAVQPAAAPIVSDAARVTAEQDDDMPLFSSSAWDKAARRETPPEAIVAPPRATPPPPAPRGDVEQALAGRWFVWIGGIAVAIGGLLFVKYSVETGLLPPAVRLVLGMLAGLVLIAGGEWAYRRSGPLRSGAPDYVPQALSAAGLAVLFAAIYAGYALYGLLSPLAAFVGLAAVGCSALALSRRQGPFIAVLGLLGSYVTPSLIVSPEPSAWGLFAYLIVVLASCLLTLRGRAWWWLGYSAILAFLLWSLLWLTGPFQDGDVVPVGVAAIAAGLLSCFALSGLGAMKLNASDPDHPRNIGISGQLTAILILGVLAITAKHGGASLPILAIGLSVPVVIAWRSQGLSFLAPAAGIAMFIVLGSWPEAAFHALTLDEYGIWTWSSSNGPAAHRYLAWMLGSGAVFAGAGVAGVLRRRDDGELLWGGLGGGAAFLFPWLAWARVEFLLAPGAWALLCGGYGAVLLAAVVVWSRRPVDPGTGVGLLIVAAAALWIMALDRILDGVWLTLAMAGLTGMLTLSVAVLKPRLRAAVTSGVAALCAIRLLLAPELWLGERGMPLGDHWVIYGFGIPALVFAAAARNEFRRGSPQSGSELEALSLGLFLALISLEIRVLMTGGITYEAPDLLEMSAQILAWAGAALGLIHAQRRYPSTIKLWAARGLVLASTVVSIVVLLGNLNPAITGEPVPGGVIFNALLLAYLAPAVLAFLIVRRLDVIGWAEIRPLGYGLALVFIFAYITLQTKRIFQGMMLTFPPQSLAETYAYSVVWLGFAVALFVSGTWLPNRAVRLAGLGVLTLVVAKVFIGDLSNLDGLFRIASFLGLGLSMIGIGWLYRAFVGGRAAPAGGGNGRQ